MSPLVVKVPQKTLLMDALKEETEIVYDFCMCNPPFFANQLEAKVRLRPPPPHCSLPTSSSLNISVLRRGLRVLRGSVLICLRCCSPQGVNSRNSRRPPPSSVNTGGVTEIMAEGGELEFVKKIIHDSLQLKKRLR